MEKKLSQPCVLSDWAATNPTLFDYGGKLKHFPMASGTHPAGNGTGAEQRCECLGARVNILMCGNHSGSCLGDNSVLKTGLMTDQVYWK